MTATELEAANVAFFDALGHDFDKRNPDAAVVADQLARALRRVLVLDEDSTSVLDYACGSGEKNKTYNHHPLFSSIFFFFAKYDEK